VAHFVVALFVVAHFVIAHFVIVHFVAALFVIAHFVAGPFWSSLFGANFTKIIFLLLFSIFQIIFSVFLFHVFFSKTVEDFCSFLKISFDST